MADTLSRCEQQPFDALAVPPPRLLTPRERAIATLAAQGLSHEEIGQRLQTPSADVDSGLRRILRRLNELA